MYVTVTCSLYGEEKKAGHIIIIEDNWRFSRKVWLKINELKKAGHMIIFRAQINRKVGKIAEHMLVCYRSATSKQPIRWY